MDYNTGFHEDVGEDKTTTLVQSVVTPAGTYGYTYDNIGNILSITDGTYTATYAYDSLNQLVRANDARAGKTYTYSYSNGNITEQKEYAYTTGELGEVLDTKTWSYGDSVWSDLLTDFNGTAITYDEVGNPLTIGSKELSWLGRQLTQITDGEEEISYAYNGDGQRVSKTVNGTTTEYIYNGDILAGQKTGNDILVFMYDNNGDTFGFIYSGTEYYYIKNAQNDIVAIADANGTVIANYYYDAWGYPEDITGNTEIANLNPLRYRSYYYDTESELYYLNSRYYCAEIGRFLSSDGYIQTGQGILDKNMFAYCENNPVNRIDPNGKFWGIVVGIICTAVLAITLTGCSSKKTSNVGAAKPYTHVSGSNDRNSPNCYAYAIGSSKNEQPGARGNRVPSRWNDVYDVAKSVESDFKSMNRSIRRIDSPNEKIYENEYKIALRVGTKPCAFDIYGQPIYDYHFMVQTSTGQWAEKHGIGGDSILWDNGMTPDTIPWTLNGTPYYDSEIIYFAVEG